MRVWMLVINSPLSTFDKGILIISEGSTCLIGREEKEKSNIVRGRVNKLNTA